MKSIIIKCGLELINSRAFILFFSLVFILYGWRLSLTCVYTVWEHGSWGGKTEEEKHKVHKEDGERRGTHEKKDQLFFNDPDGFMIELCNCENLKLVPARSLGKIKLHFDRHNPPVEASSWWWHINMFWSKF